MPSILSHPAVPLGIASALGFSSIPPRLAIVGVLASILPDADSIPVLLGVRYDGLLAHRGITHSLAFALAVACLAAWQAGGLRASRPVVLAYVFVATASHGFLDALTTGGPGVAFLGPFSSERYTFPFRVIEVSPISITRFFSPRGIVIITSELLWIWLPMAIVAVAGIWLRRARASA